MLDLSFIMVRHITNESSNKYWKESYECIRKFYPDIKISIIDDNSPFKSNEVYELTNCDIIQSEFHGRGELLPYYYFYKLKISKKAIIIHDSVFINSKINVDDINTYKFLWSFRHIWDDDLNIIKILVKLNESSPLLNLYFQKEKWLGCFGSMTVVVWDFIDSINTRFNFFNTMLENITNRDYRMCFERIIATVFVFSDMLPIEKQSIYGDIHNWVFSATHIKDWGITYQEYEEYKKINNYLIMKVWTGR